MTDEPLPTSSEPAQTFETRADSLQEAQAEATLRRLNELFPPSTPGLTASTPAGLWDLTPEQEIQIRRLNIQREMRSGWTLEPDGRRLTRNGHTKMVSTLVPMRLSADPGYNPRTDTIAARLGATYIESGPWQGRFLHAGIVVNASGKPADPDLCKGCQGAPFHVRIPHPDPKIRPGSPGVRSSPTAPDA